MSKFSIITLIALLVISITGANAEENYLNIDSKHFESQTQKNVLYFKGDVKMTKNKDILLCQSLVINTKASSKDKSLSRYHQRDYGGFVFQ